jgi:hypothetical protein
VEGYSLNYLLLNTFGYTFYSIYSTLGFFFGMEGAGTVVVADIVFAYHALLCCVVLGVQAYIYPKGSNRIAGAAAVLVVVLWLLAGLETVLSVVNIVRFSLRRRFRRTNSGTL